MHPPDHRSSPQLGQNSQFRWLLAGNTAMFFGVFGTILLRSLVAWEITGDEMALAHINLVSAVCMFATSLVSGTLIDRYERRGFLVFAQCIILLAEGTIRMSEKIGPESKDFALHVKGLEPGMHDPRIASGLAMGFILSPTGADHCVVMPDGPLSSEGPFQQFHALGWDRPPRKNELTPRKTSIFREAQCWNMVCDALVVCQFPNISFNQTVDLLKGVTGWDTRLMELMRVGERIVTLMRLFITREGVTRSDDVLPDRLLHPTKGGGQDNLKINPADYDKARDYYYVLMGWDAEGIPLPDKIKELSLEEA